MYGVGVAQRNSGSVVGLQNVMIPGTYPEPRKQSNALAEIFTDSLDGFETYIDMLLQLEKNAGKILGWRKAIQNGSITYNVSITGMRVYVFVIFGQRGMPGTILLH